MEEEKMEVDFKQTAIKAAKADVDKEIKKVPIDPDSLEIAFDYYEEVYHELDQASTRYLRYLARDGNDKEYNLVATAIMTVKKEFRITQHAVDKKITRSSLPTAGSSTTPTVIVNTPRKAVPREELFQFSGDVRDWLAFWACFKKYHEDPQRTDDDKLQLLRKSMVPGSEAEQVVFAYPVIDINYKKAVDNLRDRFGRPNVLIKVYVRELMKLVMQNASGKSSKFTEVVTQLSSQIRNLETLGVTQDRCALVLYPVVECCLPEEIMSAWQRSGKAEELDPLLEFLGKEVNRQSERNLAKTQFGNLANPTPTHKNGNNGKHHKKEANKAQTSTTTNFAVTSESKPVKKSCVFCEMEHYTSDCKRAFHMTLVEKRDKLKKKQTCFNCLRRFHGKESCKFVPKCEICNKRHPSVMCPMYDEQSKEGRDALANSERELDELKKKVTFKDSEAGCSTSTDMKATCRSSEVPLQTLYAYAFGRNGIKKRVRVIIDSGSQTSYVLSSVAKELNLKHMGKEVLEHELFGGERTPPEVHDVFKLYIGNKDGSNNFNFDVKSKEVISNNVTDIKSGTWIQEFAKRGAVFSDFGSGGGHIDVSIGNDIRPHLFTKKTVTLWSGPGPVAEETIWGWVLGGKLPSSSRSGTGNMLVTTFQVTDRPISDLWSLDSIGITGSEEKDSRAEMDKQAIQHFSDTVRRQEDGRYEVGLPWLQGMKNRLPNNYFACSRRLKSTTSQLIKNGYLEKYHSLFQQWLEENMIEIVKDEGEPQTHQAQYLPHRAVIKLSSSTTPVRPVFDASAKLKGHPSLNECVDKGANLLELIPSILTRFRLYKVGVVADIRKAFQQISVSPDDRDYLRFVWYEDKKCQKVIVFRHTRVPFGVSASPFLLGMTLQHHISGMNPEPAAAITHGAGWVQPRGDKEDGDGLDTNKLLIRDIYVDNVVTSLPGMELARRFQHESQEILAPAQFDLRGWEFGPNGDDKNLPVLGLLWNTLEDTLQIDITAALEKLQEKKITQRSLLSLAHCLFDPLRVINPFTLQAKLLLRKCHELKLGWDTPLPAELLEEVVKWAKQIPRIEHIRLGRYSYFGEATDVTLHMFCDASGSASAAVGFLRLEIDGQVEVSFLQSRSKVAPKKTCTIPRLELVSCTIGARLARTIVVDMDVKEFPIIYWTDSCTALSWITGSGPWGVFVNNRKAEINTLTAVDSWRHIPGKCNPADLPSRGCSAMKLCESNWLEGPQWLRSPPSDWPRSCEEADPIAVEAELRKTVVSCTAINLDNPFTGLLRVSNYGKVLRILGMAVQFKRALRVKVPPAAAEVDPEEIRSIPSVISEAEIVLIRYIQQQLRKEPKSLTRLRPFEDKDGVIRTKTRLTHEDNDNFKLPIILPQKDEFVSLLIRWEHENNCHMGTELLLAHLRERFWIIQGRRAIRRIIHSCWICKRFLARPLQVPEAPLPPTRTELGRPFTTIGVDAAGPLTLKNKTKVWIILFTCAVFRGVHLEVVESLSTDSFLKAFRHFVSRRARPQIVYSDNGLNFVGAQRAIVNLDWNKVQEYADLQRIKWIFNAPTAAWWSGFVERMIGVVKGLLRKMMGSRVVHLHELTSLCVEVEEVVNGRPLTYISEDPDDPQPLTPNHFIKNMTAPAIIPEVDVLEGNHLRAAFRKLQHLREALRSRFRTEYVGQLLNHHHKNKTMTLQPGDVVLIHHPNFKRLDWQLGVIMAPIPSKTDGIPRSYKVKTKGGETERPAQHLFPMEVSGQESTLLRTQDEGTPSNNSAQST